MRRERTFIIALITLLTLLTFTTCSSIVVRQKPPFHPYPGATQDAENLAYAFDGEGSGKAIAFWLFPLFLIDLPLSFALDTILLPIDLFNLPEDKDKK